MKPTRTLLTLAIASGLTLACSPGGDETAMSTTGNPLLAYVPADTPYVFANLEPTTHEVTDAYLARMEPIIANIEQSMIEARREAENGEVDAEQEAIDLFMAVYDELSGNLNREGLEAMGLTLEAHHAMYGHGLFPVMRLTLNDPAAFRATIARVETQSGQQAVEHDFNGQAYWRVGDDAGAAFIAIMEDHVAMGAWPVATAEADFLPSFLGQEQPASSVASTGALANLNREQGYSPHGSGYVDFQRVADELMDASSLTASQMQGAANYNADQLGEVCEQEIRALVARAPRATAGVTALEADRLDTRMQLELDTGLAGELTALVANVPTALADATKAFSMSLGINVGELRELALAKVNDMMAEPFQCPQLQDMNIQVQQMAAQLNQPMPPFIGNLRGFRVVLTEFDRTNFEPADARGLLSLEVENPQILTGMASMMVPGMENLALEPGGEPVDVPQELMTMATPDMAMQAVMTSNAIGVAMGRDQFDQLVPFMEGGGENGDVFLSLDYDMATFMELPETGPDGMPMPVDAETRAVLETYRAMLGRSRMEMAFTADGLVIDSSMTFK